MSRDQVFEMLNKFRALPCHLSAVKMEDPAVTLLSQNVATIVYRASESLTCGRRSISIEGNATGLWVRKGGHWQVQVHTQTIDWSKMDSQR